MDKSHTDQNFPFLFSSLNLTEKFCICSRNGGIRPHLKRSIRLKVIDQPPVTENGIADVSFLIQDKHKHPSQEALLTF